MIDTLRGMLAATALLASPSLADTVIAPGAYGNTDAPNAQFAVLGNISNSAATFQFVVDASQLTGIRSGSSLTGLGFRFAGTPFTNPEGVASFSNYSIQIGQAARTTSNLSSNFATNMGTDAIIARSGFLSIAAGSLIDLPGSGPNNFYDIGFTTPYTYQGGDLAVTLRYTPNTGNPGIAVDAFTPDTRINTVTRLGSATATTGDNIGVLSAPVARFTFAAVPEPASWALLIGGFGMVGGTVRRRRRIAAAA